ncbi:IclR family transcriptional regulator [Sedimentibacter sp.]|uniref:IclR family transcriptional regulator n=1 Tax=Sedimentibacter sp. TaxID=1960295 RepID=UPI0028973F7F|nr:IclR family transcriptional regulator [Sedimentibacter sp.]
MKLDENLEKDEKYLLTSLSKALEILDLLSKYDGLRAIDISNKLNLNNTSTFKMLYTLEKSKYIKKTEDGKYKLGIKFITFGSLTMERNNLTDVSRPFLQELRDKCNETVHLSILDNDLNVIFLVKEASTASVQMASKVGAKMPFYITALGKVLVAYNLDEKMEEEVKSYSLKKYTDNTITNYDSLFRRLEKTREQGYGEDYEENEEGLISYAAPVINYKGKTIAAISVSGPSYRMKNNKEILIELIRNTAIKISETLGYNYL